MTYLDLPAYARSSSLRMLADACGATMTAPGAGTATESGTGGSGGTGTGTGSETGTGATGAGSGGQGGTGSGSSSEWKIEDLPQGARDYISGLRSEAAGHRQAKTAAETKLTEQQEAAKVALGLAEAPNAEQLAEKLRESQAETRQARIETAIVLGSSAHGADPKKLRNRVDFVTSVGALDPGASDFSSKVDDAIKAAVAADETVRVSPPEGESGQQNGGARRPAPDRSQGSGGSGRTAAASSVQTGRDLYRQRHGKSAAAGS